MPTEPPPTSVGIILFPGFQLLDAAGPLDALNLLSQSHTLSLSILAATLDSVPTQTFAQDERGSHFSQAIVPTHTFADAPRDLDVLILPGGLGTRGPQGAANTGPVVDFLKAGLGDGEGGRWRWILTVCTGSEVLARTGALDGRSATTNKRAFNTVKAKHPQVKWVREARWVVDGNIWTSSGISAGMDLVFAWMAEVFGEETAQYVADRSEYERNTDSTNDRYAARWGAV